LMPFKTGSDLNVVNNKEQLSEQIISNQKILVVEDNLINQKVIAQILKTWNCYFEVANNGREGLKLLSKTNFDIVLMDLQMPVLNGFETTKLIREGVAGVKMKNIPIIALTADAFPETKIRVIETGMNDFVSKPFKKQELNNKIFQLTTHILHP